MLSMSFVTRIAFGVSFGLMALGAMTVAAVALRRSRRYVMLAPRRSLKRQTTGNIVTFAAYEHQNHIKRPPFLPQAGGSSLRD
jgi:hypothetical protein